MGYSDKVIDHYENPQNVGSMDRSAPDVGTGLVGAPACGDVMKLQIKVRETFLGPRSFFPRVFARQSLARDQR